jgi:cysteine desulfurase / selenocysteine lyase
MITRRDVVRLVGGVMAGSCIEARAQNVATPPAPATDWRRFFPALSNSRTGPDFVYLDSAATTQRPVAVLDALNDFYARDNANPGKSQHALARRAHEQYEDARQTVATWINAASADEVLWVRGTTEAINLVASAWGSITLRPGDEILLTVAEHASNLLPWKFAAERVGARLRFLDVDDEGRIALEDLDRKLSERTRILAFSHISNVAGYVNPAAQICAHARRAGALTLIDAAQSAPHMPIDVRALGCDFLAFSGHKMLGPMGVGVLWARRELLESMPPYQAGSNMAHAVESGSVELEHAAHKFGAGTPYAPGPLGLAAAIRFLDSLGRDAVTKHEHALTDYALRRLREVPRLRLLGPKDTERRIPVFSFEIPGLGVQQVQRSLDDQHIAIRAGDLSALPLLKRLGVEGAARASCYLYTTEADIDRLIAGLKKVTSS